MLLEGKVVFVTGGSAGIGQATAVAAAREGANIAINYIGDDAAAEQTVAAIKALGCRGIALKGDVADPETAKAFITEATAALGPVDVFVSNAGICPFHSFLDMPVEIFERTMRVNLHGAYYMVGGGGAIIAISSVSALVGGEFQTHYTPTKAGVHSLMQSASIALGRYGIRCNSVMPGAILTNINRDDLSDPVKRERLEGRIPLGRLGDPTDVADPVIFLASDLARYITGAALLIDGGLFVNLQ
jgi:L-rhamnose 1-dehydrogenase